MVMPPQLERVLRSMAETAVRNEHYFTELDGVVGDGDFGISLAAGFGEILTQWAVLERSSAEAFLAHCAKIFSAKVGGTSGSIWRAAFRQASRSAAGKSQFAATDSVALLRSAAEGIMERGGAAIGDKTLLDALCPAIDAFEAAVQAERTIGDAIAAAARAARAQTEASRDWIAKTRTCFVYRRTQPRQLRRRCRGDCHHAGRSGEVLDLKAARPRSSAHLFVFFLGEAT